LSDSIEQRKTYLTLPGQKAPRTSKRHV